MQAKNIFLGLSVAAAAVALWFAYEARAMRLVSQEELTAMQARRRELEASVRVTEKRAADADAAREQAQAKLAAVQRKAATPAAKPDAARRGGEWMPSVVLRDALLHDPKLQNLQLAVAQTRLTANYQPLCERLKLSDEQSARLIALLLRRGEQDLDIAAVAETQHLKSDDPAIAKLTQQAKDEFRAAGVELLGEGGWRELQDYERTIPARDAVSEMAGVMSISTASLDAAKADALVEIMANASAPYRLGGTVSRSNIDWDQALAAAQSLLSPEQFAVLKNGVLQTRNMDRLRELATRK